MTPDPAWVRRSDQVLLPDPRRVIAKLFLPGQEILARGISRADAVIHRVLAMSDADVEATLALTMTRFADRHRDFPELLTAHFDRIKHRLLANHALSVPRQRLIGACFTQEYAIEAAALFNPSMVAHPDQTGLGPGQLRFIMTARAVGEGHISSLEFRTGVIGGSGEIRVDPPGERLVSGTGRPAELSPVYLREALAGHGEPADIDYVLGLLPARIGVEAIDVALTSVRHDHLMRDSAEVLLDRVRFLADSNYVMEFTGGEPLPERVLFPYGADEGHGIEDVRLTRFTAPDGSVTYLGTYTAYDGAHITPHLLRTDDFISFEMTRLTGSAARDKGMALFPRQIGGTYRALSRADRETNGVASSADAQDWHTAVTMQEPRQPWELIQLGNCGPPVETSEGWLVLTHGVGPVRTYGISAVLLDLDDPAKLIGALDHPLLTPAADERDGYVPNVVYSCGGLLHGQTLVLPYGCSDSAIRFALIDVPELMAALTAPG
jgi:predicted GH43/DUF377 family glycosyl hydrolase